MKHRIVGVSLAAVVLAGALPLAAMASHADAASAHQARPAVSQPQFTFGTEGGNIRPLTVTIGSDGTVAASWGATATVQLSKDATDGLMRLAKAEGFFALPSRIVGHGLPDIAGRYITVRTAAGAKTVHVRFAHNAAFDQLYAVLAAVARVNY